MSPRGQERPTEQAASASFIDALAMGGNQTLCVDDVMRMLQVSRNTVYKLVRTGELPSFRVGRQLRFTYQDVMQRLSSSEARQRSASSQPAAGIAGQMPGQTSGQVPGQVDKEPRSTGQPGAQATVVPATGAPAPAARTGVSRQEASGALSNGAATAAFTSAAQPGPGVLAPPSDILEALPVWARGALIMGGQEIHADILANYLASLGITTLRMSASPYVSLTRMYQRSCHAAIINLWSGAENAYNRPYVRCLLPGTPAVVFRLYQHQVGFAVRKGNPKGISRWMDLLRPDVMMCNRPQGDAARVLLDEKLKYLEADAPMVQGYDRVVESEFGQGLMVSRGVADVAITSSRVQRQIKDLDFVPLQDEIVDLAVLKTPATAALVKALPALLRSQAFRGEFDKEHYRTSLMGEVVYDY